ncbi:MAG TPA: DUF2795 domain-containing protein [Nitrososphaeraceae archaeon]|jgi:hypothetical protein|nr:DUF2795 domain-containing protein [Nitrososphaeraceae archaeon]
MDETDGPNRIYSTEHKAEVDTASIHSAVNKASKDRGFIKRAIGRIEGLQFPAYKFQILDYAKSHSVENDVVSLFRSLNGTVQYHDRYQLKKSLEQENSEAKNESQISDKTRKNLQVEKIDRRQKRKDYPETPATAMKTYTCSFCGKEFQSKDQLNDHQAFEFK